MERIEVESKFFSCESKSKLLVTKNVAKILLLCINLPTNNFILNYLYICMIQNLNLFY